MLVGKHTIFVQSDKGATYHLAKDTLEKIELREISLPKGTLIMFVYFRSPENEIKYGTIIDGKLDEKDFAIILSEDNEIRRILRHNMVEV